MKAAALWGFLLCCIVWPAAAQNIQSRIDDDLHIAFLKDSIEVEENSFQFNNCAFLYTGMTPLHLEVSTTTATTLRDISSVSVHYLSLQPSEQQLILLRFAVGREGAAGTWYAFTLNIRVKETGQTLSRKFHVRVKPSLRWSCSLVQPELNYRDGEEAVDFTVRIDNTDNTEETFAVSFSSELEVKLAQADQEVTLPPGAFRTVKAAARLDFQQARQLRTASVSVYVTSTKGDKRLLVQKLTRMGSVYSADVHRWKKMPLTVELGVQSIGTENTFYTAALNGTLSIDKGRSLTVQAQANNLYKGFDGQNQVATVSYTTPLWGLTGGTLVDFNHFLVNGHGLKVRRRTTGDSYLELAGIRGRLEETNQLDFRLLQRLSPGSP